MSKRNRLLLTLLSMALVIGGGCAPSAPPPAPLTPITVQLGWTHQAQFAGLYAAAQQGFFAAEGLEVTFLPGGSGVDPLTPVLTGAAQFGVMSADELILARAAGQPVKAIATVYQRSPVTFISLATKNIKTPQDFVGKTIRTPVNARIPLIAMMSRVGITPDQYQTVDLPSDVAMFASGDVPIWAVFVDGMATAVEQAGYTINKVFPDDYGVHFYGHSLFTTDALIAQDPALVLRFLRAALRGWQYAVENPDAVGALVQQFHPEADPALEVMRTVTLLPLVNTGEDHIGWMRPERWATMAATLRDQDVLTGTLDITTVYDLTFLEEIYQ